MDLISRRDALKAVHKVIDSLLLQLPFIPFRGGERVADGTMHSVAYLAANKYICEALRNISSWHTEDPEESGEYLITWEAILNGKTYRKLTIAEWETPITNDVGDIVMESGAWLFDEWLRSYDELSVVAWMELPDAYDGDRNV